MEGFIKLHRCLLDSEIFSSKIGLKIFVWLLLKASYKKRFVPVKVGKGETTATLERGDILFGRFTAEEALNIDGSTIYKWLKKMEQMEMIKLNSNSHYTIISISNYDTYNTFENGESSNQVTAIEQPSNSHVTQTRKDKKEKESKEVIEKPKKIKFIAPTLDEVMEYAKSRNRPDIAKQFFDYYSAGDWNKRDGTPVMNWKQTFVTWEGKNEVVQKSGIEKLYYDPYGKELSPGGKFANLKRHRATITDPKELKKVELLMIQFGSMTNEYATREEVEKLIQKYNESISI